MSTTHIAWTRADLRRWFGERSCACGSPERAAACLLRLLRLHPLYEHRDELEAWISDDGIEYFLLYVLDRDDLTEHGGTVGGAWLTDQGVALRDALEVEEADGFEALFGESCIHGYDVSDVDHDCRTMPLEYTELDRTEALVRALVRIRGRPDTEQMDHDKALLLSAILKD